MPEPRTNKPQRVKPGVDPDFGRAIEARRADPDLERGLDDLARSAEEATALQIEIARIPTRDARAAERARFLESRLRATGLDVRTDTAGNVHGVVRGSAAGTVIVSAHLDTVFPNLLDIEVERQGHVLRGPGIADDAAGLAGLVHLARATRLAGRVPRHDIAFVCTVGEEGEGDLCGVKHLFEHEFAPEDVVAFLTLDLGVQGTIVNQGLGSRRFQVTFRGPGGHSWADFGRPNPAHALARGLAGFLETEKGKRGVASFNVGTLDGGRGVTAIPETASARVDLRAVDRAALQRLERTFRDALRTGFEAERSWSRDDQGFELDLRVIGDRPSGRTPAGSDLVRALVAGFRAFGIDVELGASSTDANAPMSRGVAAVAVPHGVRAHNAHSLDEWCDVRGRPPVLSAIFVAMAHLAGC